MVATSLGCSLWIALEVTGVLLCELVGNAKANRPRADFYASKPGALRLYCTAFVPIKPREDDALVCWEVDRYSREGSYWAVFMKGSFCLWPMTIFWPTGYPRLLMITLTTIPDTNRRRNFCVCGGTALNAQSFYVDRRPLPVQCHAENCAVLFPDRAVLFPERRLRRRAVREPHFSAVPVCHPGR